MIGNGSAWFAKVFAEDLGIDFALYTDPSLETYKALGFRSGMGPLFSIDVLRNSRRAFDKGFRQSRTRGSAMQLGGVLIARPDGSVAFLYRSRVAGDHPDNGQILDALRQP